MPRTPQPRHHTPPHHSPTQSSILFPATWRHSHPPDSQSRQLFHHHPRHLIISPRHLLPYQPWGLAQQLDVLRHLHLQFPPFRVHVRRGHETHARVTRDSGGRGGPRYGHVAGDNRAADRYGKLS